MAAAEEAAAEAAALSSPEMVMACGLDLAARASIAEALRAVTLRFGGVDCVINTAAIYPTPDPSTPAETVWSQAMTINVSSNHVLAQEAAVIFKKQGLPVSIVLTSSANAVVPKQGSEPYDVSKAAINHLIRELAVGLGPHVRVNGIAPATVVAGSAMFPRDRVIGSLTKYQIAFSDDRIDGVVARQAGGVLRAANHHAAADPAVRLCECDLLAGGRPERQDDGTRDPDRWRAARGAAFAAAARERSG